MAPDHVTSALPPLSPQDESLLRDFLEAGEDISAVELPLGFTTLDIVAFTARPDIAAWLDHIHRLNTNRLRAAALASLERLLAEAPDPIEERRTAGLILRATNPSLPRVPQTAARSGRCDPVTQPAAPPSPRSGATFQAAPLTVKPSPAPTTPSGPPPAANPEPALEPFPGPTHPAAPAHTHTASDAGARPPSHAPSADPGDDVINDAAGDQPVNLDDDLDEDLDEDLGDLTPQQFSALLPADVLSALGLADPPEPTTPALALLAASGRPTRAPPAV